MVVVEVCHSWFICSWNIIFVNYNLPVHTPYMMCLLPSTLEVRWVTPSKKLLSENLLLIAHQNPLHALTTKSQQHDRNEWTLNDQKGAPVGRFPEIRKLIWILKPGRFHCKWSLHNRLGELFTNALHALKKIYNCTFIAISQCARKYDFYPGPIYILFWLVVKPTHLKNMLVKLDHLPRKIGVNNGKHKTNLKPPPSIAMIPSLKLT